MMLDDYLIDYLRSGNAWLLVGSGPSMDMGYPSWEKLASALIESVTLENRDFDCLKITKAFEEKDYPRVFSEGDAALGNARMRQILSGNLYPTKAGKIYELIAQWPIKVYLTTNYDNEIHDKLVKLGEAYRVLSNSKDHMSLLNPDLSGAVLKLHGDLTTEDGLILTSQQYQNILEDDEWEYWRTRMMSVFQMCQLIVLGHSLSDINIKHVLETAKLGAGIERPICWIAPNVSQAECIEYLEKYKIRIICYESSGGHSNLVRLIETINDFVPSRTSVPLMHSIKSIYESPLESELAAPGFFVFNKFCEQSDLDGIQTKIIVASIQAVATYLQSLGEFSLEEAVKLVGWPQDLPLSKDLEKKIGRLAIEEKLLVPVEKKYRIASNAVEHTLENTELFNHIRERFKESLVLRILSKFPDLKSEAETLAEGLELSLVGYFKENGLTLASTLLSSHRRPTSRMPTSIIKYLNLASNQYETWTKRQAFTTISIDIFKNPRGAEKEYLGRIARGFYAFHALGVFGEVAVARLQHAAEAVWLMDSYVQIRALALGDIGNYVTRDCLLRLKEIGLRFFSTGTLFLETVEHLRYAATVIAERGTNSYHMMAAAQGQTPYRQSNEFLRGFIRWQKAGNPANWQKYLYSLINSNDITEESVKNALKIVGLEVVNLIDWPGFSDGDYPEIQERTQVIKETTEELRQKYEYPQEDGAFNAYKKAVPEGEASIIVKKERRGEYYINSAPGDKTEAWFISGTSILNIVEEDGVRLTWQPAAFFQFASTLCKGDPATEAEKTFESIVLSIAESGVNLIDDDTLATVFGGIIDQAKTSISEQASLYNSALKDKYAESPQEIIGRINPLNLPIVAMQLANEVAQREHGKRIVAETTRSEATTRANRLEGELRGVKRLRLRNLRRQSARKKPRKQRKKR